MPKHRPSHPKTAPAPVTSPTPRHRLHLPIPFKWLVIGSALCVLAAFIYLFWGLPDPSVLTESPSPASTKLLDRQGRLMYEIFTVARRTPIKIDSLPDYVKNAHIAAEDKDFYTHNGFSLRGIGRAVVNTFFKRNVQGGSTITQQLVRLAILKDQSRTPKRKAREFVLSLAVEAKYSKDQILEMYLNQVPYGGTAYGLEAASQTYFGKHAADLSLAEAALIAGLPQAPSAYSPFGSKPELAKERQAYVLSQMLEDKFISQEQYDAAKAAELKYATPPSIQAPHFSLWVKDLLTEKYGLEKVESGGLIVTTTLDLDLQNFAQTTMASEVGKLKKEKVGNGAALVTHPKTGEILAMVGSKDYFDTAADGNVNVTLRSRQPGSSIKPINYAIGIDRKLFTAGTLLADKATCFASPNQPAYCPDNYDNQFHGPTQVRFALANSFNIPAVKALVINGLSDFVASSSAFGISTYTDPTKYGPSIALGGGEVTMLDLVKAYGVLANAGQRVELNPVLQVTDSNGTVLEEVPHKEVPEADLAKLQKTAPYNLYKLGNKYYQVQAISNTRVISAGAAFIISHILYDNGARSATFGSSSYLNVSAHPEVSVKTGTTNDKRDNWTIGYNPDILAAVWVGNNDNTPMSAIASGVTGASPIWNKIIKYSLSAYPQNWPPQPADVIGTTICNFSGLKAPDNPDPANCPTRYEYFLDGTIPAVQTDNLRRDIPMLRSRQTPATTDEITRFSSDIETQNHAVVFDALGTMLCLDCAGGYGGADNLILNAEGRVQK